MTYIYIRLGCLLQKNTKTAKDMTSDKNPVQSPYRKTSSQCPLRRRKEQNEKTVKMFFVIVLIFLVFMMPNQILWLLYDFGNSPELLDHIDLVAFVCRAFTYTNSVLNALVYGACNRNFRRAFKAIIRCKCGRSHQREAIRSNSIRQGKGVSEVHSGRARSPLASPKKIITVRYITQHSYDSIIEESYNSDFISPVSPGNQSYAKTEPAERFSSLKNEPMKTGQGDPKTKEERGSKESAVNCTCTQKEKNVSIDNNIQIFTFEREKIT